MSSYAPAMDLSEYLTSDATTLAGLVAEKDVTAVELLALARQRCDAVNRDQRGCRCLDP